VKTTITDVAPMDFVEGLEWPRRQEHGRFLLEVFERVTGVEPVMWGPTMVGYGEAHYVSPSGREGDWFVVGFSPRKANLALYGLQSAPDADELLPRMRVDQQARGRGPGRARAAHPRRLGVRGLTGAAG
jgi:hypothetical protein